MPRSEASRKDRAARNAGIETRILRLLAKRKQTLALAESCTGGYIAHRLTNIPGASESFLGGVISYSNSAKRKFLGVPAKMLAANGAVSEAVARAMAEGARKRFGADFAVAVTGIAGPSGGTEGKPAGTVYMAVAGPFGTSVKRELNGYERLKFKEVTGRHALLLLRSKLGKSGTICA